AALGGLAILQLAQPAKLVKGLLRGLFADVAGVDDDHVGAVRRLRRGIAERCQDIRHAGGIIDVHLATIGADEKFLRQRSVPTPAASRRTCRRGLSSKALI